MADHVPLRDFLRAWVGHRFCRVVSPLLARIEDTSIDL